MRVERLSLGIEKRLGELSDRGEIANAAMVGLCRLSARPPDRQNPALIVVVALMPAREGEALSEPAGGVGHWKSV